MTTTWTINLDMASSGVVESLSDGTLSMEELATIYEQQTGKTLDLKALAENGDELNIVIDDSCGESMKMDFGDTDLDFLNITDKNETDLDIIVADSDGLVVEMTSTAYAHIDGKTDMGSLKFTDTGDEGDTIVKDNLKVILDDIQAAKINTFNIGAHLEVDGFNIEASMNVNLAQKTKGQLITQSSALQNINKVTNIVFNIKGSDKYTTNVNYDKVDYNGTVSADTKDLKDMAAGIEVWVNQTGGVFNTTGSLKVDVDSVLGDTKGKAYRRQLESWASTAFANGATVTMNGKSYTTKEAFLADLAKMSDADIETMVSSGQLIIKETTGSSEWVPGNATGNWHWSVTLTKDPAADKRGVSSPGTYYMSEEALKKWNDANPNEQLSYGVDLNNGYDKGGAGYKLSQAAKNWICGGTSGGKVTTTTISTVNGDDYQLAIGSQSSRTTSPVTTCNSCDPVAMIHIVSLGFSVGSASSLYLETTNTGVLQDFVGSTGMANSTSATNGTAGLTEYMFRTGVDFVKDMVESTFESNGIISYQSRTDVTDAEKNAVTAYVQQDVTAVGTQKGREAVKMSGGYYNEAGHKLTSGQGTNNSAGLNMSIFNSSVNSAATISEIQDFLSSNPDIDMNDVSTWTSEFFSLLETTGFVISDATAFDLIDLMGTANISAENVAKVFNILYDHAIEAGDTKIFEKHLTMFGYQMTNVKNQNLVDLLNKLEGNAKEVFAVNMINLGSIEQLDLYMATDLEEYLAGVMVNNEQVLPAKVADYLLAGTYSEYVFDSLINIDNEARISEVALSVAKKLDSSPEIGSPQANLENRIMSRLGEEKVSSFLFEMLGSYTADSGLRKTCFAHTSLMLDRAFGGSYSTKTMDWLINNMGETTPEQMAIDAYVLRVLDKGDQLGFEQKLIDKLSAVLLSSTSVNDDPLMSTIQFLLEDPTNARINSFFEVSLDFKTILLGTPEHHGVVTDACEKALFNLKDTLAKSTKDYDVELRRLYGAFVKKILGFTKDSNFISTYGITPSWARGF